MSDNPKCRYCDAVMGRWAWWESDLDQVEFWFCFECNSDPDRQHLAIQVLPRRKCKT
jgi:hypothetical protein